MKTIVTSDPTKNVLSLLCNQVAILYGKQTESFLDNGNLRLRLANGIILSADNEYTDNCVFLIIAKGSDTKKAYFLTIKNKGC